MMDLSWLLKIPTQPISSAWSMLFGKLLVSINTHAGRTYYNVPDYDDNRNIFQLPGQTKRSYEKYRVALTITPKYDITTHSIDGFVYAQYEKRWLEIHENIGHYLAGPDLTKIMKEFEKSAGDNAEFPSPRNLSIPVNQSKSISITRVGEFLDSRTAPDRKIDDWSYVDIFLIFRINNSFMLVYCTVPQQIAQNKSPYFVGRPVVRSKYDLAEFLQIASETRQNYDYLHHSNRFNVLWRLD